MVDTIVSINVGGRVFQTRKSTLCALPYFEMLERRSNEFPPRFVDRSPRLFEHILNTIRNPEYLESLPAHKILRVQKELEFYGIGNSTVVDSPQGEWIPNDIPCENDFNNLLMALTERDPQGTKYIQNPEIFGLCCENQKPTEDDTRCFEQLCRLFVKDARPSLDISGSVSQARQWDIKHDVPFTLPKDVDYYSRFALLLPEGVPLNDVHIEFYLQNLDEHCCRCSYNLAISHHLDTSPLSATSNIVPLRFMEGLHPFYPPTSWTNLFVRLLAPSHKDKTFRFRARATLVKSEKLRSLNMRLLWEHVQSQEFKERSTVDILPALSIRAVYWWTRGKTVPWVQLHRKYRYEDTPRVTISTYARCESQYLERQDIGLEPLPDGWGCIHFGTRAALSGSSHISTHIIDTRLVFPEDVSGHIWIVNDNVIQIVNGFTAYTLIN